MALGHEAAGVVEALGDGVTDLARRRSRGARLRAELRACGPAPPGGRRFASRAPANGAGTLISGERRLGSKPSRSITISASRPSPTTRSSRAIRVKIDPDMPFEIAALFGCAVLTGVGAVINTAKVQPGASIAMVGLGGVGLSAVLGAKLAGARQIVAVDLVRRQARDCARTRGDR